MAKIDIIILVKKKITPLIAFIKLVWHNYYSTCKQIYQAFLSGQKKNSTFDKSSFINYFFSLSVLHEEINIFRIAPQALLSFLYWFSSK